MDSRESPKLRIHFEKTLSSRADEVGVAIHNTILESQAEKTHKG
ncbi:hypothetical protein [Helicobacter canis]|nr:hypothetical protein [Helicobacter canis]